MADRGDELILQPIGLGQVLGHLVDGLAQAAHLVVIPVVRQAHLQIAFCNFCRCCFNFPQRPHDGAHKKQPAPNREHQHQHTHAGGGGNGVPPLAVRQRQAGDKAHGRHIAGRVGHQLGHSHHPFALGRGEDVVSFAAGGSLRRQKVGAVGQVACHGAAAGGQDDPLGVQQHKLELVLFVELLDGAAQGLAAALGGLVSVARRAGGLQAARNGGKAALRRPLHAAVQFPIIGIEEHHFSRQDHQHGDQQAAPHPPLGNASCRH